MRVLYVGALNPYASTCYSRFCALKNLEPDTHAFNFNPYFTWERGSINKIHQALETHLLQGPRHNRANEDLIAKYLELSPDIVWIDTGVWLYPDTLRELKKLGCFLVMHITDALVANHWRVRFKRRQLQHTLKYYDVFFTSNIDDYQSKLTTPLSTTPLLTDLGYDDQLFTPVPLTPEHTEKWNTPIVFIGHYEPSTEAGILALIDAGLPVKVYGHAPWFKSPNREKLGDILHPSLNNDDYVSALKGAAIGLCFLSTLNYNQTAGRSFEIPGTGTFLLAVRTQQHLDCYDEGIEAEFFGDHAELIRKAKYYLDHVSEREAIALRGLKRCQKSGYSWDKLMARDWPKVLQLYVERQNTMSNQHD